MRLAVFAAVMAIAVLGAAPLGEEGAGPPRRQAALPDEVDARLFRGADLTLAELLRAGGRFTPVMLAFSVGMVAVAIYSGIGSRRRRVIQDFTHVEVVTRLEADDLTGARAAVEGGDNLYARAARAALCQPPGTPPEELRASARASGERDAAVLRARIVRLVQLGAIAALVGLLGTVTGMIQAFGAAAREEFHHRLIYAGAFKALVTTFFGLVLATVAIAVSYVLRGLLERALADAACALEELVAALRRRGPGVVPGRGPGAGG